MKRTAELIALEDEVASLEELLEKAATEEEEAGYEEKLLDATECLEDVKRELGII